MGLAGFDGIFWIFFSMNVVFLLISYIPMFPAFLKMRKVDPAASACSRCQAAAAWRWWWRGCPAELVLAIIATIVPRWAARPRR